MSSGNYWYKTLNLGSNISAGLPESVKTSSVFIPSFLYMHLCGSTYISYEYPVRQQNAYMTETKMFLMQWELVRNIVKMNDSQNESG